MHSALTRTIAGFLAGALAVAIFHQSAYLLLAKAGVPLARHALEHGAIGRHLWHSVAAQFDVLGGLWGILYALILEHIPTGSGWLKGFIFGLSFRC